jgi:phosphopantetheinyl transferase
MIHWLLQTPAQCPELAAGVAPAGLLSAAELERMEQLTTLKRQREWLLGRCAAKRLVQRYLAFETGQRPPLDALVIARESDENAAPIAIFDGQATPLDLPDGARWVSGLPLVAEPGRRRRLPVPRVSGMRLPISLSISHSSELVLCALYALGGKWHAAAAASGRSQGDDGDARWQDRVVSTGFPAGGLVQVGVDVEHIEPRADSFLQAYFAVDETRWIGQALGDEQALLATVTWSAKEAVLKALHLGLTVNTQRVICLPATGLELTGGAQQGWSEVHVQCDPALLPEALGQPASNHDWSVRGWWRREGRFVLTLAALHVAE